MEKIAVLADIHGNLEALQATIADISTWSPDMVIVAGDIVNRGPRSSACLELVLHMASQHGWHLMRGNHERYLLSYNQERLQHNFPHQSAEHALSRVIAWTHDQLVDRVATVAALPEQLRFTLDAGPLVIYHASMRHDRDGLMQATPEAELRNQIDSTAAIFCAGHTHMPFVRQLSNTLVVNVGAVGLPFDGDRRAAYARLTRGRQHWSATIMRIPYDVDSAERAFHETGMLDQVGAHGRLMLRELQTGRSLLFPFINSYHARVSAGVLSIDQAVDEFMDSF